MNRCFTGLGLANEFGYLREFGVSADARGLNHQSPTDIDCGTGHQRSHTHVNGHAFTGQQRFINRAGALDYAPIGGYLFAWPDHHDLTDGDVSGIDGDLLAIPDHYGLLGA